MPPKKSSAGSKLVLSIGLIIASAVYAAWQNIVNAEQSAATQMTPAQSYKVANDALVQTLSQINNPTPPAPTSTTLPTPGVGTSTKPKWLYADGSYAGDTVDAYYGLVQVKAIIAGGKIVDVQFLQYPSDRSTSRAINSQAMPLLTHEAIQAQSANVSGVSGASATSGAFAESLTSALALAKN